MSEPLYYPWQIELFDWLKAEEVAARSNPSRGEGYASPLDKPKARMSDLLRFARLARNQPEIWGRFIEIATNIGRGRGHSEQEQSDLATLCGQYASWYRMKNGIDDVYVPFALTYQLLLRWASGEISEEDEEAARACFRSPFTNEEE